METAQITTKQLSDIPFEEPLEKMPLLCASEAMR
jgi:hypothetical protein